MRNLDAVLKESVPYSVEGNILHFILKEEDRPEWSRALDQHLVTNKVDLKMSEKYQRQKNEALKDEKRRRFFDFILASDGAKVDLASGPSGYFSPILDGMGEKDIFIATDACPSVVAAHSAACDKDNFFVFDIDLDKELPFTDQSIAAFSGNYLDNVEHYGELLKEIHRCLKPGGRFAVIEIFFEKGSRTYEHLNSQGAVWASFETFTAFCENLGFRCLGSDILLTRKGKIDEGDLYPLDENDCSAERTVYFEKREAE